MLNKNAFVAGLVGGLVALTGSVGVFAQELTPQASEAVNFFHQLVNTTHNPLIAAMARENLAKLNSEDSDKVSIEVPLMSHTNSSLAVPALLDGKVMATFVVDTGATHTVITPRMARKLGIKITPQTRRISMITANGFTRVPVVTLRNVSIGKIEVAELEAVVQDLGDDVLLGGLLGMNYFRGMDLTVKYDKLVLQVDKTKLSLKR
jgi:clan AA aspartic protease (TIGR02281 family)